MYQKEIMHYLINITPDVEVYSIDEAFINFRTVWILIQKVLHTLLRRIYIRNLKLLAQ